MAEKQNSERIDETIVLDYGNFENITLRRCRLIYKGGLPPILRNVSFVECTFMFDGPAKNTQEFLTLIARTGGAELVVNQMLGLSNWGPK